MYLIEVKDIRGRLVRKIPAPGPCHALKLWGVPDGWTVDTRLATTDEAEDIARAKEDAKATHDRKSCAPKWRMK